MMMIYKKYFVWWISDFRALTGCDDCTWRWWWWGDDDHGDYLPGSGDDDDYDDISDDDEMEEEDEMNLHLAVVMM